MKAYKYDNELVYYFETGDPAKPKMIFFHNGGTDHRVWKNQIDFFSKDFHIYAIDMPGYGRSKTSRENFELNFFTEMISTFIDSQKIEKCILVGNCIGAAATLLYANQFPRIVTKLVLFQIASKTLIQAGALGILQKITGYNQFTQTISANLIGKLPVNQSLNHLIWKKLFGQKIVINKDSLSYLENLNQTNSSLQTICKLKVESFSLLDEFQMIPNRPPLLLFWGIDNKILPCPSKDSVFITSFKADQLEWVENAGHLLMLEQGFLINQKISAFLKMS